MRIIDRVAAALHAVVDELLLVANDPDYMGDLVYSRFGNGVATIYLVLLAVVAVATVPLMIATKAGS